jgi:pSer/pThr/pTyr-binding forkhead associated (FHA) protein
MAVLIGMSEEVKGQVFKVEGDQLTLGRSKSSDVTLDNPTVSGSHCCITRDDTRFVLRDLGSTNGTRHNSREVAEAQLSPKDLIQVGSVEFMFDAEPGEQITAATSQTATVQVASGPVTAPQSFASISPYGARKTRETKGPWFFLIIVVGLMAIAAVAYLLYFLFRIN